MSKSVHQEFKKDALQHFGLEATPAYGVVSNSMGEVETIIASDSEAVYNDIKAIIGNPTTKKMGTWKRAFLLPKSPISIDRVRSALKEHNIVITNDINAADVIITHDDFHSQFRSGGNIHSTAMMGKIWNYDTFKDTSVGGQGMRKYIIDVGNAIIYDGKCESWFKIYNADTDDSLYDAWLLTGMAVNLAHKIQVEHIDVMEASDCLHQSATKLILDEQLVKDIATQVNSHNEEDNAMAAKILPTIDYESKYHLLWDLCGQIDNSLYKYNRNKDVQYWKDMAQVSELSYKSAEDMILWLDEEGKLSQESFRYLEPIVRKEIRIENRSLYVFKIQVKPEYRHYLKPINKKV